MAYDRALRAKAVELRSQGLSYREIGQVVGVAKSTLSVWLSGVPLTEEHRASIRQAVGTASATRAESNRALGSRRRAETRATARAQIGPLSENELFLAGVVAYWAEGAKNKPWRHGQPVEFLNSDAGLILLFLAWLRMVDVTPDRVGFRLRIHESGDVERALEYWSEVVSVPAADMAVSLKRHNPLTVRKNTGASYHGCLGIRVRGSTELNLRIAGWCEGLGLQAASRSAAGSLVGESGVV